jgi:VCBS repeat-containing protein
MTDQLVLIDPLVPDLPILMNAAATDFSGAPGGRARAVVLDGRRDALQQIAEALEKAGPVAVLHVMSHGAPGELCFAAGSVSAEHLIDQKPVLDRIAAALAPDAEVLIWSCHVGSGIKGARFISLLAEATGANVMAATHAVGHADRGGTWQLDVATGVLPARPPLPFAPRALSVVQGTLNFTVVSGPTTIAEVNNGGANQFLGLNVASYNAGGSFKYAITWGNIPNFSAAGGSIDLAVYNFDGSTSQNVLTSSPLAATATNIYSEPVVTFLTAGATAGDIAVGGAVTPDGTTGSYDTKVDVLTPGGAVVTNPFTANQTTAGDQLLISLAGLPDGRLAAVWESSSSGGSEGSIKGAIYNANGSAFVPEFNIQTSSIADTPQVVALGAGKMEVVWETQNPNNANDTHVYEAQVSYDPSNASSPPTVAVTELGSTATGTASAPTLQFLPSVTALSDGGFVVAYGSYNNATQSSDLLGHIVTGTGAVHDFTIAASTSAAGVADTTESISTATLSNGDIVVAWLQEDTYTGSSSVEVQLIDQTGGLIGAQHTIAAGSISQSNQEVSVAALQNGEFVVSWVNDGGSDGYDYKVESEIFATAPVVTAGATVVFNGGGAAVTLDSGVTVSDSSSIAGATVSIGSGFQTGDTLNFSNQNGITGSYDAATGKLTLTGTASAAQYQAALDSITFSFNPSNGDPTAGGTHTGRTIDWAVTDSDGSSNTAVTSSLTTSHVAPTVTANAAAATYNSGGAAVVVDAGLTVNDVDSSGNLTGATVTISSGYISGDQLAVGGSALIGTSITAVYNATTHQLTLSGTDTLAHYQAALESITFGSSATNPTNGGTDLARTINWSVTDGVANSNTGTSTVNIVPAPSISSVVATTPGNATDLDAGNVVTITVHFSNAVNVTGTPELQLNDNEVATYTGGSGTGALTFSYTVQPTDNTADLQVQSLLLNGGSIKDGAGNDAVLTNAATDLHLQVDTTTPTVSSINLVNSTPNHASSEAFTVTFSESVTGVDASDFTASGSGTANTGITVTAVSGSVYTVTVNGVTGDGTLGLNLNSSGTGIADLAGNAVSGGLTGQTYTVDHTPPAATSISLAPNSLDNATSETFTVTFSESVTGVAASDFTVSESGTAAFTSVTVTPVSGSIYTVTVGGVTGDGTLGLDLNTGSGIQDLAGNAISGGFTGSSAYTLDHSAPSVASINLAGATPNNASGEAFTVTFSESVTGVDASDFTVVESGTAANTGITVTPVNGSNGSVYTVTVTGVTGDGTLGLNLNSSGTGIVDLAGNAISGGSASQTTYTVDHTEPVVASVGVPANGTYAAGQNLDLTVNFSEAVAVTGTPEIALTLDTGGVVDAQYVSGSGTSALTFRYIVVSGEADANGIGVGTAIILNGGSVKDAATNDAALALNSVASTAGVLVDSIPPIVTSVAVPVDGVYSTGQDLDFSVDFTKVATVNTGGGIPYIDLTLDTGGTVHASYLSGSGTGTLVFRYVIPSGELDTNGITVGANLVSNGGTIQDAIGNDAAPALNNVGSTASVLIDSILPTVTSIDTVDNSVNNLNTEHFTVTFSAPVNGVDISDFTLVGTASGSIATVSGSGATWTVTVGNVSGDGTLRLDLNNTGAPITDNFGNTLTAAHTGDQSYTIDHTAPTVSVSANSTTLLAGRSSVVTFTFSETIASFTSADINVTGGVLSNLTHVGVNGTNQDIYTATFTPNASNTEAGSVQVNASSYSDTAGNAGAASNTLRFSGDTLAPTVTSLNLAGSTPNNATSETFTVTFSESVTGVVASDFTVSGSGTANTGITVTPVNGSVYTVTVHGVTGDGTLGLNLNSSGTGIKDLAGNAISVGFTSGLYTVDHSAPQITAVTATPSSGVEGPGQSISIVVAFGEAVTLAGGTPTLSLNDNGIATYDAAATAALHDPGKLVFDYTVSVGNSLTSPLAVTGINLHGAVIDDLAGNAASLGNIAATFAGLGVDSSLATANPDSNHVVGGQTAVTDAAHGVLANDTDTNPADHLVVSAVDGLAADVNQPVAGAYGTLTMHADGSYVYTANSSVSGAVFDTFTYAASNGHSAPSTATLTIEVTGANQNFVFVPSGGSATTSYGNTALDGSAGGATLTAVSTFNAHETLVGGPGDILNAGNFGQDTFVFAGNFGHETINNFHPALDVIQLQQSQFGSLANVMADLQQVGSDSVLTLDANHVITITNTQHTSLTASDFHLV